MATSNRRQRPIDGVLAALARVVHAARVPLERAASPEHRHRAPRGVGRGGGRGCGDDSRPPRRQCRRAGCGGPHAVGADAGVGRGIRGGVAFGAFRAPRCRGRQSVDRTRRMESAVRVRRGCDHRRRDWIHHLRGRRFRGVGSSVCRVRVRRRVDAVGHHAQGRAGHCRRTRRAAWSSARPMRSCTSGRIRVWTSAVRSARKRASAACGRRPEAAIASSR